MTACPKCGADARVRKTVRPRRGELARRQRVCGGCGLVFLTREVPVNLAGNGLPATGGVAGNPELAELVRREIAEAFARAKTVDVPPG